MQQWGLNLALTNLLIGIQENVAVPFGGIKDSGLGREGGAERLGEYQNLRYMAVAR